MTEWVDMADIESHIGKTREPSDWLEIDQDRVNAFADATLDHQFIHLDEEAAELIRFQQAYQAAAEVISVAGDLFDTLLAATRR